MAFWNKPPPPEPTPLPEPRPQDSNWGWSCASRQHPSYAIRAHARSDPGLRMYLGLGQNDKSGPRFFRIMTDPQAHVLVLGPPRSIAGKTASVMIPIILQHEGPVVSASTKPDILNATAMHRAQYGRLWSFAPDGESGANNPGVTPLRWSPLVGAAEWDTARESAIAMTRSMDVSDVKGGSHWSDRAGDLIAALLHYCALRGLPMRRVVELVNTADPKEFTSAAGILDEHEAGSAAGTLRGFGNMSSGERGSVCSSAARALSAYSSDAALAVTENPNFDADDFVKQGQYGCRADTIYITAASQKQSLVAPLVVALLTQIQSAAYRLDRIQRQKQATVFALDELYGLAPLPNLPEWLSTGGSQGVLIAAAVQDLTLIKSRWPKEAASFMTLFGHVVVFPGIRDGATLEAISKLIGDYDRERITYNYGREDTTSSTTQRERIVDVTRLWSGLNPDDPHVALCLAQNMWHPLWLTPYYQSSPWPQVLTEGLHYALARVAPRWMEAEAVMSGRGFDHEEPDYILGLPVPDLTKWADACRDNPKVWWWQGTWARLYDECVASREQHLTTPGRVLSYRRTMDPEPPSPPADIDMGPAMLRGPNYTGAEWDRAIAAFPELRQRLAAGGRLTRAERASVCQIVETEREELRSGNDPVTSAEVEQLCEEWPALVTMLEAGEMTDTASTELRHRVLYRRAQTRLAAEENDG